MKKFKLLVLGMCFILGTGSFTTTINAYSVLDTFDSEIGIELKITDEQLNELQAISPENTAISDEEISDFLVENSDISREEINKINLDYDNELKEKVSKEMKIPLESIQENARALLRIKRINGYNKYRIKYKKGVKNLYLYLSGRTLAAIKSGASVTATISSIIKISTLAKVIVGLTAGFINDLIGSVGTKYGIVLMYPKDKWCHLAADTTYRYDSWFYQT